VGATCEAVRDRAICRHANLHNIRVCVAIRQYVAATTAALNTYNGCVTMGWRPDEIAHDARCLLMYEASVQLAGLALRRSVDAAGRAYDAGVQRAWNAYHACTPRTGNNPPSFPIDTVPPAMLNNTAALIDIKFK
jgi:hypothetical protein